MAENSQLLRPRSFQLALHEWRKSLWLQRALVLLTFLAAWEIAAKFYPPILLPGAVRTFNTLTELLLESRVQGAFIGSLWAMLIAFAIAVPSGILLGIVMGGFPRIERILDPYLNALYVTPKIMLIPLFIIWFGIGIEARIAYILVISYFPIAVTTMAGVRSLRGNLAETARAFGGRPKDIFLKIYLPGSVPMMMAGVRLAFGRALVGMITAEMFLAIVGLGQLVVEYGNRLATDRVLALAVLISILGIAVTEGLKAIEHKIAPWIGEREGL